MMILGVDTGGTFTDFLLQQEDGSLRLHKVLSTPHAPERAILQGIAELGLNTHELSIIHGSTVATNAILEGKGVKTVYITNTGLADVLVIGRQARRELYNLTPVKKPPLLPHEQCVEVDSRLSAQGERLSQLDDDKLHQLLNRLDALQPEAVAINLLFSFIDASEEVRIEQAIQQHYDNRVFVSRSSDVLPEYREYERGMTTTLNAMVGPLMQNYLARLQQGVSGSQLSVMQSSAGVTSVEHAGRYPVHLLLSGPAGGLLGAKTVAEDERLLTFDMGGTSTDVSIIDGEIGFSHQAEIAGYPVAVPMIDMHTIGAGGGSIARVDEAGLLLVGPQSAGADPGPACYGKGGSLPTVTDANVVLGRLLPQAFLGGNMRLDKQAAQAAVQTIADKLGCDLHEAAQGIIDVVNDHMAQALRVMSVQRGENPKHYTLVSFGGAGGLHVCALAEALGMQRVLAPVHAGVLSALGMLAAQQSRERSRSVNVLLSAADEQRLAAQFADLVAQARRELTQGGDVDERVIVQQQVDLRYHGQSHTLTLPWQVLPGLQQAFHRQHEASYGHRLDIDVELVNLRVRVMLPRPDFRLPEIETAASPARYQSTDGETLVIARDRLRAGDCVIGPALITETASTTWLEAGWLAQVQPNGSLLLQKQQA